MKPIDPETAVCPEVEARARPRVRVVARLCRVRVSVCDAMLLTRSGTNPQRVGYALASREAETEGEVGDVVGW